jgi:hypothetical protein
MISTSETNTHDRVLRAIGLAVVNFSKLQDWLARGVCWIAAGKVSYSDTLDLLVADSQFRPLVEMFAAIYRHRFPGDNDNELKNICKQLSDMNTERNRLFHSLLTPGEVPDQLRRYKRGVRSKALNEHIDEAFILKFAEDADQTTYNLVHFLVSYVIHRDSSVVS